MEINIKSLCSKVKCRAPSVSFRCPGPYRRFPGYADDAEEDEVVRFHTVLCTVQTGLAEKSKATTAILDQIIRAQFESAGYWFSVVQAFDGTQNVRISRKVLNQEFRYKGAAREWAAALLKMSGDTCTATPPLIVPEFCTETSLKYRPYKRQLRRSDLIIVFGREGEFRFHSGLAPTLRKLKKQIIVVEFDNDDGVKVKLDEAERYLVPRPGRSDGTPV